MLLSRSPHFQHFSMLLATRRLYCSSVSRNGLVVGVHEGRLFTPTANAVEDSSNGNFANNLALTDFSGKVGETRVLLGVSSKYPRVAVVGLGPLGAQKVRAESSRQAAAAGVKALRDIGCSDISVEELLDAQGAAEGAHLAVHTLRRFKTGAIAGAPLPGEVNLSFFKPPGADLSRAEYGWRQGTIAARAHNLARDLADMPANHCTPRLFSSLVQSAFEENGVLPKLDVVVRNSEWIREQKMGTFSAVAQGSNEDAVVMEVKYSGAGDESAPIVFLGKGVTFDSGGICIKPSENMAAMKADMTGAGAVMATMLGIAEMGLPINVVALAGLTENMPSGAALKPGDVVSSMCGKTVEVDNTDAEGRLVLADLISYALTAHSPATLVDVATLTGAADVALGDVYAAAFTSDDQLWKELKGAGEAAGQEFWRMPLSQKYLDKMESRTADLKNAGGRSAGACTAAAFLQAFVNAGPVGKAPPKSPVPWAHLDIAGVMESSGKLAYLPQGMCGGPVRALLRLAEGRVISN